MSRLGLLDPSSLNQEQKVLYDVLDEYTRSRYTDKFIYRLEPSKQLVGPFGVQLHTPEVGHHFIGFARALATIPGLPAKAREMAILVVGSSTDAAYEDYAHSKLSGYSRSQLDQIHNGQCPAGLSEIENVAFEFASDLLQKGPLSQAVWEKGVSTFGIDGAKALVHYVGFYRYVATILNGFDVQVPE